MVKIKSSAGGFVNIDIRGIEETKQALQKLDNRITTVKDREILQAATLARNSVQESIAGLEAEQRSVRTGLFGNSIEAVPMRDYTGDTYWIIRPKRQYYPGTATTTEDVATILEYGTQTMSPRRHFRNTYARIRPKIEDKIRRSIIFTTKEFSTPGISLRD